MHGFLLLDKPVGMSSAHAVGIAKRLLQLKKGQKIGHAGTLDPLASGLLPLAVGEATKALRFVTDAEKEYQFSVRWGEQRSTDDAEGEVVGTHPHRPSNAEIEAVLGQFTGDILQAPPSYSAIKVDGKRAYAMARAGEEVVLPPRPVQVFSLELTGSQPDEAAFRLRCGKGTYVRSIARDMALALGTLGYVSLLRRTRVGKFDIKSAFLLEKPGDSVHSAPALIPILSVLDDIPAVEVDEGLSQRLRRGQAVPLPSGSFPPAVPLCITHEGRLVGIAEMVAGQLKPMRIFNL